MCRNSRIRLLQAHRERIGNKALDELELALSTYPLSLHETHVKHRKHRTHTAALLKAATPHKTPEKK